MSIKDFSIRAIRYFYRFFSCGVFLPPDCICDRQTSNNAIYQLLEDGTPTMISRLGTTEINCINNYLCIVSPESYRKKIVDYISGNTHTPWWDNNCIKQLYNYSGVFPIGQDIATRFSELYLNDIPEIDLIGCHQYYERFMPLREDVSRVQLEMLYPFFVDNPWTRILKGKRVLVIHPFEQTIKNQYEKRHLLFDNPEILPDFELITLKAVQTIAGNKSEFANWFDALAFMERKIERIDFDIAIIGCGAYGLPLAAFIKRIGKQAIHLGGGTQLLFGILGKRWTESYKKKGTWNYRPGVEIDIDYTPLFNEHWIYPLAIDTPQNTEAVENSCYWK